MAAVALGAITCAVTATRTVDPVRTIILGTDLCGVIQQLGCDYNAVGAQVGVCAAISPRGQSRAAQESIVRAPAENQLYPVHQHREPVK